MMTILLFVGVTLLLILEGACIAALLQVQDRLLRISLGLPIGTLINVLLVGLYTVTGIPLTWVTLVGMQIVLTLLLLYRTRSLSGIRSVKETKFHMTTSLVVASAVLACTTIYAFSHAVLLPTFQFDSLTNWTMRSKISFMDQHMAFDLTEERGMAKPQYPYLFHALQITANEGHEWNDTAANTILFLLGLSSFIALFLLLRELMSSTHAALTLALAVGTPLLAVHLAQGYGDSVLIQYIFLAHAALLVWIQRRERVWLLISALMIAASVWSKAEGLVFGLLPWLLTLGVIAWREKVLVHVRAPITTALVLSLAWTVGAMIAGLSLTPHHGSDATIVYSAQAVQEAFTGLFSRGSFGIGWYAVLGVLALMVLDREKRALLLTPLGLSLLAGLLSFTVIVLIYTITPNSQFLLKGESYYRQMLLPLGLFILSLAALLTRPVGQSVDRNQPAETRFPI